MIYTGPEPTAPRPPTQDGTFAPFETFLHFVNVQVPASRTKLRGSTKHNLIRATRVRSKRLPDLGRIRIALVWTVSDKRVTDVARLIPIADAFAAGLLLAGVVQERHQIIRGRDLVSHAPPAEGFKPSVTLHIERMP